MSEEIVSELDAEKTVNSDLFYSGKVITLSAEEQTDLEKLQAALQTLKQTGETLFADQIAEIESKIEEEKAKVEAETEKVVEVAIQTEQSFVQKYGAGTARTIEIVLLGLILYKLF